jgi:very-short-patch-repair endonuclease
MRGPNNHKTSRARELRSEPSRAESILWQILRNRQLDNIKFSRQVPIGPYFADFCCRERKLVIELDGPTHEGRETYDLQRTEHLENLGYKVIRFTNEQIFSDLSPVLDEIRRHL